MKWKKRQREKRLPAAIAEHHFRPLIISPWRMAIARVLAWIAARATRVILAVATKAARAAIVRQARPDGGAR